MSTSCPQAIEQQLEAMPLEEFEDLLKGALVNKGHEGMPQHAALLSQLKHQVKVQPDEPIQTKATDKDCRTFLKSLNQFDKTHRLSSSSTANSSGCPNLNGNVGGGSGNHNSNYNHYKHPSLCGSTSGGRSFPTGDQNANPVSSTSDTSSSSAYNNQPVNNLIQGKHHDYNNHHIHQSTLTYGNCVSSSDADPDDDQDDYEKPGNFMGTLPAPYLLPSLTNFSNKELPLQFFQPKSPLQQNSGSLHTTTQDGNANGNGTSYVQSARPIRADTPSSSSWESHHASLQLNDSYKNASSVASGASSCLGRSQEQVHGTIQATSPNLPFTNSVSFNKSPPTEGSQFDKPTRRGGDRKKKSAKNVLRETVINPQEMPGYKGTEEDIDKLLEFVEGNPSKPKDKIKGKEKKRETKVKADKQVLSKAASLDENSLEYGSKKLEDPATRSRTTNKEVEKKNATNITKSASVVCSDVSSNNLQNMKPESDDAKEEPLENISKTVRSPSAPVMNGSSVVAPKSVSIAKVHAPLVAKSIPNKSHEVPEKVVTQVVETGKRDDGNPASDLKQLKPSVSKKSEEDKFGKLDESDGPYVLVQSKKKKEKKKFQQRESEAFVRPHIDQTRRDVARARRNAAERRKSVGSVPGSENSECSDDDDSVRSLPAGECTPREKIPKPCSSSGGTPQTSYADIARISRDEGGKTPSTPISIVGNGPKQPQISSSSKQTQGVVSVASDSNFPALSPPSVDKTVPPGAPAVWPCRPRVDNEVVVKEKPVKENPSSVPVIKPADEVSVVESKCSVIKTSESTQSTDARTSPEGLTGPDMSTVKTGDVSSAHQTLGPAVSETLFHENVVETVISPKTAILKRTDELKIKEKSKVSEDSLIKTNSVKPLESTEMVLITEPVVFCGGKFDGGQIPVGQTIGFEFGFGVIEALSENGVSPVVDEKRLLPKGIHGSEAEVAMTQGNGKGKIRSQESGSDHCEDNDVETLPKSTQKQEQLPKGDVAETLHGAKLKSSVSDEDSRGSAHDATANTRDAGTHAEQVSSELEVVQERTDARSELSCDPVNIRGIYVCPPNQDHSDLIDEALAYRWNYAERLTTLGRAGKINYHRL